MKKLLLALFVMCSALSFSAKVIKATNAEVKGNVVYEAGQNAPYTGIIETYNEKGVLGFPISDVVEKKGYKIQHYEKGNIMGNDNLGYWEIQGDVFKFYNSLNDLQKDKLGLPLKNEVWNNNKWTQYFERGLITGVGDKYILKIDK